MKNLREQLPALEADYLLPLWLLLVIVGAAIGETVTIGLAVEELYNLKTGWIIGGVIASTQAMASMMWARASQHNTARHIVYKRGRQRQEISVPRKRRKGNPIWRTLHNLRVWWMASAAARRSRPVENRLKSEPRLNTFGPLFVSALAGITSAWVGVALYSADGAASSVDVALAVASPVGSFCAALLNGLFAYGEGEVARWRTEADTDRTVSKRRPAKKATGQPRKATAKKAESAAAGTAARDHLDKLREAIAGQHGRSERPSTVFVRQDAQAILGLGATRVKAILNAGKAAGLIIEPRRFKYQFTEVS